MRITKITVIRSVRTFLQAFLGALITAGAGVNWLDIEIKQAIVGILITSFFAGLSAMVMNLEVKENEDSKSSRRKNKK